MFLDRLKASFALAQSSWQVLRTDKQLILFPVVSGVGCALVLLTFLLPFALFSGMREMFEDKPGNNGLPAWFYLVVFAYYFVNYFVIIFCNSALISCALIRFNGGTPTLRDGFDAARSRLPQILAWSFISATVGMILQAIENAHEKVGEIIRGLLGTAWTVLTFFVVPVLVVEKVDPFTAIRRSLELLKKTWGEALVGNVGIGLFIFLATVPGLILVVFGLTMCFSVLSLGLMFLVLGLVYVLGVSAIGSAMKGIYLSALYQYATHGSVPEGFDQGTITRAFAKS
jgi:hypothetical protein